MARPARVAIDIAAARHNLARVREYAPRSRVVAVIKADGYGHGLTRMAQAFAGADALGVACAEEALSLRAAGVTRPIVLLEGVFGAAELDEIRAHDLDLVVHHDDQIEMLERTPAGPRWRVWLKLDSGMHRLGFAPERAGALVERLRACGNVASRVKLMTHLACAHDAVDPLNARQLAAFDRAAAGLDCEHSIANSAAVVALPGARRHWVRPGLMLYGVSPVDGASGIDLGLRPVMTLQSELIAVKHIAAGEPVGYGATWRSPEPMPIGIVAMGYGDGYPRHAESGTPALVNGVQVQLIGRPSMDMLCVDLRNAPHARVGDPVVLWGHGLPVETVARHASTVGYQLVCSMRMRARYVEDHG